MAQEINRRDWIKTTGISSSLFLSAFQQLLAKENPVILLRSGWQYENIGDIAHTPGLLQVLQTFFPTAKIVLWSNAVHRGVDHMLKQKFPSLEFIKGTTDSYHTPTSDELKKAFAEADFMLHGSGPSVVAQNHLQTWKNNTNKPYGIYGVTIQSIDEELHDLLSNASFVFTRETKSLQNLKNAKVTCPHMAFTPDATFALNILDDEKGLPFLRDNSLEEKEFICIVPRLRYTPYHQFKPNVNWSQDKIGHVTSVNEATKEKDHKKLRTVITKWVRETGKKVLVCPEMTYALDIIHPLVVDPLTKDVKPYVTARKNYWLTDEAASVYKRAHTIVSMECHSPIIAAANGTPCFYVRQPTDTIKGEMWRDVGLHDWIFEIDDVSGDDIYARLKDVNEHYEKAQKYLQSAMKFVQQRHQDTMHILKQQLV